MRPRTSTVSWKSWPPTPGLQRLGDVIEHTWGQRVIRFYDPDRHLIEVGEDMNMVVRRFLDQGMTLEEVSARMDVSVEDLNKLLLIL